MTIQQTLEERKKTHGEFCRHAFISQSLKVVMRREKSWIELDHRTQEALEMIAHKIARILNGNPEHADHWHDIAGYATLVEMELMK